MCIWNLWSFSIRFWTEENRVTNKTRKNGNQSECCGIYECVYRLFDILIVWQLSQTEMSESFSCHCLCLHSNFVNKENCKQMPSRVLNFLNPIFTPSVKCNAVADDLYLPENLLAADRRKFDLGFMAYHVTKPPIELDFHLMCGIELSSIKIWPKIGSQKSTGFEVYVSSRTGPNAQFIKVASCFNLTENGVVFVQPNREMSEEEHMQSETFKVVRCFRTARTIRTVRCVRICIRQTNRCVPVLKRIEIWGRIASSETEKNKQTADALCQQLNRPVVTANEEKTVEEPSKFVEDANNRIPEHFLDAITYEIMALPMVLPSGKTIDHSTLAKHNSQEEHWGRPPSDPFTGVMLTESRKAILNTLLKSQIDKFLLENDHLQDVRGTGRTVATVTANSKRRKSLDSNEEYSSGPLRKLYRSETNTRSAIVEPTATTTTTTPLDDAVRRALQSATRFSAQTPSTKQREEKCCLCTGAHGASPVLYQIKLCSHLICRNCLVEKASSVCMCGTEFQNVDITKYYRKYLL